ncbi:MAG: quinolinate synthase NadA, partial [Methylibium petroleiphilum]
MSEQILYDFTKQDATGASCTSQAWAKVPEPLTPARRDELKARARRLLAERNAVLVAHYYVDGDLQDLAL